MNTNKTSETAEKTVAPVEGERKVREWWLCVFDSGHVSHSTKSAAKAFMKNDREKGEIVKVQEVLPHDEGATGQDRLWCAYCGVWGDHQSGTCSMIAKDQEIARLRTALEAADGLIVECHGYEYLQIALTAYRAARAAVDKQEDGK